MPAPFAMPRSCYAAQGSCAALWGRAALWGPAAVCAGGRWPAREIATRELRSEWSISRPALALPPPTGTAARPRHPRALQPGSPVPTAPSTSAALCRWRVAGCVVSKPGQALPPPTGTAARPCRRPRALQLGPLAPSGLSGALHTGGAAGIRD